jgi:hypothetical protein
MLDEVVPGVIERVMEWLLRTGHRNLIVDLANESHPFWKRPFFEPDSIHRLIEIARSVEVDGRRLLVGASSAGGRAREHGKWLEVEDVVFPHGNGLEPEGLRAKLRDIKSDEAYAGRPRPIVVNEDSVFTGNMEAAVEEGASWGFYCQGYGSGYADRSDWKARPREDRYEDLSGFQTVPVNWGINTPTKRRFFDRLAEITGSRPGGEA